MDRSQDGPGRHAGPPADGGRGGENPEGDPGFLLRDGSVIYSPKKKKKKKENRKAVDAGERNAIRFTRPGFIILFHCCTDAKSQSLISYYSRWAV